MGSFYWDRDLTATDSFAGAGGLSCGLERAGASLQFAVNHDERSIATYRRNFPHADVRCAWLETINWKMTPDTLIKVGGPECTNHSRAKGEKKRDQRQLHLPGWTDHDSKPEVEKSRASMWQVYRAAKAKADKHMPYHSMIFENVPEVAEWSGYRDWLQHMQALSDEEPAHRHYEHQILSVNAMHFGIPQCRDRWIAVFWPKGARKPDLNIRPSAFCRSCDQDIAAVQCWKNPAKKTGRYDYRLRGQYTYNCPRCSQRVQPYYRCAAEVIDFSDRGIPIGERRANRLPTLNPATMQRIADGINQFFRRPSLPPPEAREVPHIDGIAPFWITYYSNGKPYSI